MSYGVPNAVIGALTSLVLAAPTLVACREVPRDAAHAPPQATAHAGAAHAEAAPARILYPNAPGSFVNLIAGARHGVVAIRSVTPVKSGPAAMFPGAPEAAVDVALGTGFLVEAKGVYVVTNDHVVAGATELRVVLPDHAEVPAKVIGRDPRLDLALLSIDVPRLAPLAVGDSNDLQVGEWLVVLGNPFGDELTASAGIVSATGREAAGSLLLGAAMSYRMMIQTDARIHRGNSGGPVLNAGGQVVGVAVATGDRPGEISFVIPIKRVLDVFEALRDHGQVARSWLGILVKPVTTDLASSLGLPSAGGALVTEIKAASPGARAGLRAGDVILRWGDRAIDDRSLPWIVASTPVGRPTSVIVWRNRAELPVPVVTEKMPE